MDFFSFYCTAIKLDFDQEKWLITAKLHLWIYATSINICYISYQMLLNSRLSSEKAPNNVVFLLTCRSDCHLAEPFYKSPNSSSTTIHLSTSIQLSLPCYPAASQPLLSAAAVQVAEIFRRFRIEIFKVYNNWSIGGNVVLIQDLNIQSLI